MDAKKIYYDYDVCHIGEFLIIGNYDDGYVITDEEGIENALINHLKIASFGVLIANNLEI